MGIYTVVDAASRSGLSRETWTKVERGETVAPVTYRKVEALLKWEPGSCGAVLAGGEPTPASPEAPHPQYDVDELRELREQLNTILDRIEEIQRRRG